MLASDLVSEQEYASSQPVKESNLAVAPLPILLQQAPLAAAGGNQIAPQHHHTKDDSPHIDLNHLHHTTPLRGMLADEDTADDVKVAVGVRIEGWAFPWSRQDGLVYRGYCCCLSVADVLYLRQLGVSDTDLDLRFV